MRKFIKSTLGRIPPFDQWIAELARLRLENDKVRAQLQKTAKDLQAADTQLRSLSNDLERLKLWVPPGHFYSPIPAIDYLKIREDEVFGIPEAIRGVDLNEGEQLELLNQFRSLYIEQPFTSHKTPERRYSFENPNYGYGDAITLYCMLRHLRPRRIVEVGSGYSSCVMLDVNDLFFDRSISLTFIDPYPQLLKSVSKASDLKHTRIIGRNIQDVDLVVFKELKASDILFIDSSHVSKTGSDLNYIVFKILPLIAEGVFIHFHDIFYPFEYPKDWVFEGRSWNEAYLLRAFLQYNRAFRIRFFTTYLLLRHRAIFEKDFPLFLKNMPGSLWLEKTVQDMNLDRPEVSSQRTVRKAPQRVDLSHPEHAWFLGEGWHAPELDHCWMESDASVQLAAPTSPEQKLRIFGYTPHSNAQLSVALDDFPIGSVQMTGPGRIETSLALPENAGEKPAVQVHLSVDQIFCPPNDPRNLGFSLSIIEIS